MPLPIIVSSMLTVAAALARRLIWAGLRAVVHLAKKWYIWGAVGYWATGQVIGYEAVISAPLYALKLAVQGAAYFLDSMVAMMGVAPDNAITWLRFQGPTFWSSFVPQTVVACDLFVNMRYVLDAIAVVVVAFNFAVTFRVAVFIVRMITTVKGFRRPNVAVAPQQ